jgi:cytochrome P450
MATSLVPPGPKGHLLGGNLPEFRRGRLDFLTRCAHEYGDVVRVRFGPRWIYLLIHPDAIEQVLVTESRSFTKHFALRLNPLILGNGLLTSEGEFWLRQRRLAQPAFQRSRIAAYGPTMVEHTLRLLASWHEGETCDILSEMMRVTLGIAAKTLFDAEVEGKASEVGQALAIAQKSFVARFNSLVPPPMWMPTPGNRRLRQAVQKLDDIIYGFIRQRRASGEDKGDLLSMLLHAQDETDNSRMTDKQLRDEAMTLFLAGHETTALTLSWAWYLLASHPEAEARLVEEVQNQVGAHRPAVEDWPRLHYTEWVVLEAMRLYPPAYVMGREAIADRTIAGFPLRAGTTVLMPQWVVHRDPRWWDQPELFRPERWDNDLQRRLPKYAYFPFGGGPRLCIGNTFAMMEAVLILATIAQQYRFTIVPDHPVIPLPSFTLRPQYGIKAVLQRRT